MRSEFDAAGRASAAGREGNALEVLQASHQAAIGPPLYFAEDDDLLVVRVVDEFKIIAGSDSLALADFLRNDNLAFGGDAGGHAGKIVLLQEPVNPNS